MAMQSNIFKTALFFEGGSMRGAYSAGANRCLVENEVFFDSVYGISAGSSNAVNYLTRDVERITGAFGHLMADERAGSWKSFIRGRGLFDVEYLYNEADMPGGVLPFDYETFSQNPATLNIFAFDRDRACDVRFTAADMHNTLDVMQAVRASSTLPIVMPATKIGSATYYDGGFGVGGGLPMQTILDDGFKRMVVIRTRPRGYRKGKPDAYMKTLFLRYPAMRRAVLTRNARYNQACDLLDEFERDGRAYVFYPTHLTLSGTERDALLLESNIQAGYAQMLKELGAILDYVQAGEEL